MKVPGPLAREMALASKFAAVCLIGFGADVATLWAAMRLGVNLPVSRLLALLVALQVTFILSRRLVFRTAGAGARGREWSRFMIANGFGGLCNFGLFVGFTTSHWPWISNPWVALVTASSIAYAINYAGTRLFVYRRGQVGPPRGL